jgi:Na+-transporting NADH:ubiquinone oxidoreductase subunit NqrE
MIRIITIISIVVQMSTVMDIIASKYLVNNLFFNLQKYLFIEINCLFFSSSFKKHIRVIYNFKERLNYISSLIKTR